MAELTEQECEEAFIMLALSPKDAELYRRYCTNPHDELDKVGIPDLRRKMWEMTSRQSGSETSAPCVHNLAPKGNRKPRGKIYAIICGVQDIKKLSRK